MKYGIRKEIAEVRPRVRGRFVKVDDAAAGQGAPAGADAPGSSGATSRLRSPQEGSDDAAIGAAGPESCCGSGAAGGGSSFAETEGAGSLSADGTDLNSSSPDTSEGNPLLEPMGGEIFGEPCVIFVPPAELIAEAAGLRLPLADFVPA